MKKKKLLDALRSIPIGNTNLALGVGDNLSRTNILVPYVIPYTKALILDILTSDQYSYILISSRWANGTKIASIVSISGHSSGKLVTVSDLGVGNRARLHYTIEGSRFKVWMETTHAVGNYLIPLNCGPITEFIESVAPEGAVLL